MVDIERCGRAVYVCAVEGEIAALSLFGWEVHDVVVERGTISDTG